MSPLVFPARETHVATAGGGGGLLTLLSVFLSFFLLAPLISLLHPPRPAPSRQPPRRAAFSYGMAPASPRPPPPGRASFASTNAPLHVQYLAGVADHRARPRPARGAAWAQTGCAGRGSAAVAAQTLGQRRAFWCRVLGHPPHQSERFAQGAAPPPAATLRESGARHDCKEASMGPSSDG